MAYAFDDKRTHPRITQKAVIASTLGATLTNELGIADGIGAILSDPDSPSSTKSQRVIDWLGTGSTDEDSPFCRPSNHFHNPLQPYPNAGMTDREGYIQLVCGGTEFNRRLSSAIWGTSFKSPTEKGESSGNKFDWDAARAAFKDALTLENKEDREAALARTFLYLGDVIHLVQDLANPSHVRDDFQAHLEFTPIGIVPSRWFNEAFEGFVRRRSDLVLGAGTVDVPFADNFYVTRFWDTGRYGQQKTPSADITQGLAEYSSANFVSKNSILKGPFPYPMEESTNLSDLLAERNLPRQVTAEDGIADTVLSLRKSGDGEVIDPFLKAGYFTNVAKNREDYGIPIPLTFQIDDEVMTAYASKLIPRAIGYSAGLLNYFFRGKLDFKIIRNSANPAQASLTIYNMSDERMTGSFTLYAESKEGKRVPIPGASVEDLTLSGMADNSSNSHRLTFTPDPAVKMGGLTLVFSGTLGAEQGAIVGKVKPWEPEIFVIQDFAELTGGEQIETQDWCVDRETGYVCYYIESATNTRSKDPRLQRASGHFVATEESDGGEYIKRISVAISTPAEPGVTLRLNGDTVVGREWSRDKGPALVPKTWEVVIDLTQIPYSFDLIALPTLSVETHNGRRWSTEIVWWGKNVSIGSARYSNDYDVYPCKPGYVLVHSSTGAGIQLEVYFGNGFIPAEGVGGFEVGTYINNWGSTGDNDSCPGEASYSNQYVEVFTDGSHTPTKRALVSQEQGSRWWVVDNPNLWAKPPGPPPAAPQLVPRLRFRRQYSPEEMLWYQQLGITLPEYETELR